MLRVVFLGNGYEYSLGFLKAVLSAPVELAAIVVPVAGQERRDWPATARSLRSRLGRLAGSPPRGIHQLFPWEVARAAESSGAELMWPHRLRSPGVAEEIARLGADLVVMAGFNEIIRPAALRVLPQVINVHPSLLPEFRGPHPEFWTLAHGARTSGVTLHCVDQGVDTGDIVAQERFQVEPWLTGGELQQRAIDLGGALLRQTLADWEPGRFPRWAQEGEGSYQQAVSDEDLAVPFSQSAQVVYDRARAGAPWIPLHLFAPRQWCLQPSHYSMTASASRRRAPDLLRLELRDACLFAQEDTGPPGTLRRTESDGLSVACRGGTVYFRRVKVEKPR
jgi:methionyl-tRNA formyltransferase